MFMDSCATSQAHGFEVLNIISTILKNCQCLYCQGAKLLSVWDRACWGIESGLKCSTQYRVVVCRITSTYCLIHIPFTLLVIQWLKTAV